MIPVTLILTVIAWFFRSVIFQDPFDFESTSRILYLYLLVINQIRILLYFLIPLLAALWIKHFVPLTIDEASLAFGKGLLPSLNPQELRAAVNDSYFWEELNDLKEDWNFRQEVWHLLGF